MFSSVGFAGCLDPTLVMRTRSFDEGLGGTPRSVDSMPIRLDFARAATMAVVFLAMVVCLARRIIGPWAALCIIGAVAPTVTATCMAYSWLLEGDGYTPYATPLSLAVVRMLSCYAVSLAATQHVRRLIIPTTNWAFGSRFLEQLRRRSSSQNNVV